MKTLLVWLIVTVGIVACAPIIGPTAVPATPSPTVDNLTPYRLDLNPANEQDLATLDRPTRYNMTLVYNRQVPSLAGSEDVQYYNRQKQALGEIYFRLFANYPGSGGKIDVSRVLLDGSAVSPIYEADRTALKVPLSKPLAPGASARINVEFTVTIPRNSTGHYSDFTANDSVVTIPSAYPLIPAYDSRGWSLQVPPPYGDLVYADASFYAVTITVPSGMNVIASGSTLDTKDNGNGTTTWRLVGAPMRDFDINLSDQLQVVSAQVGDTTVNSWYETADAQAGKEALQFATAALADFESRFGPYPYREFDVVETPTTAGGIEYPGLVVVARNLYHNNNQRTFFEFATVHEVSHQWWYGLVGDDQVNDPWVDESLAQYSALIYEQDHYGPAAGQTVLRDSFMSLYNQAKSNGHDAAVDQPVSAFTEADYGAIVYGKGPLFYDAIRSKMGDDKFFAFLKTYLTQFRYKIAFPEDILRTAEASCGCSLQDEYKQWILSPAK